MEMTISEQIRAGLQKSFQSGTSAKASTVCYGYKVSRAGELVIDPAKANTVLFIFHHFMNGDSLGKISDALARIGIASPTGRATWSRETISKLLANEKYVGDVILGKINVIIVATVKEIPPQRKEPTLKKVAAYCRVSTKDQDQLDSLAAQERYYDPLL